MPATYRQSFDLNGKIAVVTGACGILGRHFAAALADHGAAVAVVDLDESAAESFAGELAETYGVTAAGIACDVSAPDPVEAMIAKVGERLGSPSILINNAASKTDDLAAFFAPVEETSLETWREVMSVNLEGLFLVAREAAKAMIAAGRGGSIVQLASIYGVVAPDNRIYEGSRYLDREINTPPVYSASKAGVIGLTRHLAAHWAPQGIRVNALTPGGVESGQNETFSQRYSARVPLGRMARAEEMTGAAVFLASDAASYVTGQNIVVDGGLTSW